MKSFKNARRENFLASRQICSLDDPADQLAGRCKFNFHYFVAQAAGQDFVDWNHNDLVALLNHLKDYSNFPLTHWQRQPVGKSGTVLAIYGGFPNNSDFQHPLHVPHQARWGRFRLNHSKRLVGFIVPKELDGVVHEHSRVRYCANTFYVVFLDADHRFWKGAESK